MITSLKVVIIRIITLFCDPNLNSLFNQFNISSHTHDFEDPGNVVKCKYYNLEEVQTMKITNKTPAPAPPPPSQRGNGGSEIFARKGGVRQNEGGLSRNGGVAMLY